MSLKSIFDNLETPDKDKYYNADIIDENSPHQIAKDHKSRPILLIKVNIYDDDISPVKLDKIYLQHNKSVFIKKTNTVNAIFSVLSFLDDDTDLQNNFLDQVKSLIACLPAELSSTKLNKYIKSIIEIWRLPIHPSEDKIIGLWGELFIIHSSSSMKELITAWHKKYKDKYDFFDFDEAIEVKCTTKRDRKHRFKLKQLIPVNEKILIASVMLEKSSNGKSLHDLKNDIENTIDDAELKLKLKENFYQSVGTYRREHLDKIKFDYEFAKRNLKHFYSYDIPQIGEIPPNISNVTFDVDLMNINSAIELDQHLLFSKLFSLE